MLQLKILLCVKRQAWFNTWRNTKLQHIYNMLCGLSFPSGPIDFRRIFPSLSLVHIHSSHSVLSLMTVLSFLIPLICIYAFDRLFSFSVSLPLLSFCPIRTIDNKVYVAEIKEKHQAKKIYEKAYQQGKTSAHIGVR